MQRQRHKGGPDGDEQQCMCELAVVFEKQQRVRRRTDEYIEIRRHARNAAEERDSAELLASRHDLRCGRAERASWPRRIYLYGIAFVGALLILFELAQVVYRLLLWVLGDPNADFFGAETLDGLVRAAVAAAFWAVHILAIRDDTRMVDKEAEAAARESEQKERRREDLAVRIEELETELSALRAELAELEDELQEADEEQEENGEE